MSDEIKLPEPAFRLRWDGASASYRVSKPNIGDTDVYTAEQVRALLADSNAGREPTYWYAECADPDYSRLYGHKADALTQISEHGGGTVTALYEHPPT